MKIQIKNRWNQSVIFEAGVENIKAAVLAAIEKKESLSGANLSGAYLSGADLSRANLSGAILRDAYLIGANLKGEDLARALATRTIVSEGVLTGWKKLEGGVIC